MQIGDWQGFEYGHAFKATIEEVSLLTCLRPKQFYLLESGAAGKVSPVRVPPLPQRGSKEAAL
jgi:hypothetical protein